MDIMPGGLFSGGGNTPGQTGMAMLTDVQLRFGPTDEMPLRYVLDCIAERTPDGASYPFIAIGSDQSKGLTPDEARTCWERRRSRYEKSGWKPAYDIWISFTPDQKALLESCVTAIDSTLIHFLIGVIDAAWGKAPDGTPLN